MLGNDDIYTELTVCWSSKCFTVSWIERWHLVAEFLQDLLYVRVVVVIGIRHILQNSLKTNHPSMNIFKRFEAVNVPNGPCVWVW